MNSKDVKEIWGVDITEQELKDLFQEFPRYQLMGSYNLQKQIFWGRFKDRVDKEHQKYAIIRP